MIEEPTTFGPENAMVGILTTPAQARANAPVVLLTNAGVLPRQGPHRLNVRMARALAREGFASLRFDLSGNGDSLSIGNSEGILAQAVDDFKSAMDWAQRHANASSFLIFGICSGAVHAYNVAKADDRVAGILMFDGYWYHSRYSTLVRDLKRGWDSDWPSRIAAIKRRLLPAPAQVKATAEDAPADLMAANNPYKSPPIEDYRVTMQALADRGTDIFLLFGGSIIDCYSYGGQFRDVFAGEKFYPHVRCEFHPDIDHVFVARHAQQKMVALACDWVGAHSKRIEALQHRA